MIDGKECFVRLAERIALLYGATDEQAADIAKRHYNHFVGRDYSKELADEVMDWIRDEVGESDSPRVVGCDDKCGALLDPITLAEIQAALAHWRYHGQWGGCSHAR